MSTFNFPTSSQQRVVGGQIDITFINNDGASVTIFSETYFLKMADVVESIEESGIGGVMRISDMQMEIYDRNGLFRNQIFNKATVTKCYAKILFLSDTDGNYYTIIFGTVDLSTIRYPSYYDDEAGTEAHSCQFTIFALPRLLETAAVTTLQANLTAHALSGTDQGGPAISCVKIDDVLLEISKLMTPPGVTTSAPAYFTGYKYLEAAVGHTDVYDLIDIYVQFTAGAGAKYLFENTIYSWLGLKDCKSVLFQLAGDFCCYPEFVYDAVNNQMGLQLHQMGRRAAINNNLLGVLKSSTESTFYGYDAFRTIPILQNFDTFDGSELFSPANLNDTTFDLVQQKFDYRYFFRMNDANNGLRILQRWRANSFGLVSLWYVNNYPAGPNYNEVRKFLMAQFTQFWTNPSMIERTYSGSGIGKVRVLDRITIGSKTYTITEIKRKILSDEMEIKAVQY